MEIAVIAINLAWREKLLSRKAAMEYISVRLLARVQIFYTLLRTMQLKICFQLTIFVESFSSERMIYSSKIG